MKTSIKRYLLIPTITLLSAAVGVRMHAQAHPHPPKQKPQAVAKQDAEQLIDDANTALAFTVKAARAAGKELDPKNPVAKPFYDSLKSINASIDDAKKSLAAKDNKFFADIADAKAGVEEMKVNFVLTKSKNPDVILGGKKLSGAVTALEANYSPLEARKAKGGELTADEKAQFQKLKASHLDLAKEVDALAASVQKDPALKTGLKEVAAKARAVAKAPETPNGFAAASNLASTIVGLLNGFQNYATPAQRSQPAWKGVTSYVKSAPARYSYYTSPGYSYNWSYTTTPVGVYDNFSSSSYSSSSFSSSDVSSEDSFLEENNFDSSESEEAEVAEESDDISEDEANDAEDDLDSPEDDADDSEDADDAGEDDDGGDDDGGDDDGGDDDGGDDDGGDDDGGDDDGGDDDGGDDDGGDDGGGDDDSQ